MISSPKSLEHRGHRRRCAFGILFSTVMALGLYGGNLLLNANFHTVVLGEVYRSGQMNPAQLAHAIETYGIESVLNLRGKRSSDWYREEVRVTSQLGVRHYDFRLSARQEATDQQMARLLAIMQQAPKPLLIHCKAGADRTGLASALYCLVIQRQRPVEADEQLTVWDGHVPLLETIAMDRSFWHYAARHPEEGMPSVASEASLSPATTTRQVAVQRTGG